MLSLCSGSTGRDAHTNSTCHGVWCGGPFARRTGFGQVCAQTGRRRDVNTATPSRVSAANSSRRVRNAHACMHACHVIARVRTHRAMPHPTCWAPPCLCCWTSLEKPDALMHRQWPAEAFLYVLLASALHACMCTLQHTRTGSVERLAPEAMPTRAGAGPIPSPLPSRPLTRPRQFRRHRPRPTPSTARFTSAAPWAPQITIIAAGTYAGTTFALGPRALSVSALLATIGIARGRSGAGRGWRRTRRCRHRPARSCRHTPARRRKKANGC